MSLLPGAQRRHGERHHVQAVEEIEAEGLLLDGSPRGPHSWQRSRGCRPGSSALSPTRVISCVSSARSTLAWAGSGMSPISSRKSVNRRCAASKWPDAPLDRAGEAALLVAEELRFDELVRNRGAVHGHERPGSRAVPGEVQVAGDDLFARAVLTGDQDRGIRVRDLGQAGSRSLSHRLGLVADERPAVL